MYMYITNVYNQSYDIYNDKIDMYIIYVEKIQYH